MSGGAPSSRSPTISWRVRTDSQSWAALEFLPSQRSMQGVVDILAGIKQIPASSTTGQYFQPTYLNQALQELGR